MTKSIATLVCVIIISTFTVLPAWVTADDWPQNGAVSIETEVGVKTD